MSYLYAYILVCISGVPAKWIMPIFYDFLAGYIGDW